MSRVSISVVIPCRNERETLADCLDALEAQDFPASRFEILAVDGHSTDGCAELLRARRVRMLHDEGRGPAAARNLGVLAARGEIVAFTDADCVPRFDWLSRLYAAFEGAPEVAGVAGGMRLPRSSFLGRLEDNDARIHYRGYITSNIAYRRRVLLEVGGFDERLQCAEDYDLAWRVLDRGYRIEREPAAVVLHDPPELHDALGRYLAKQFWYARHDVPTHVKALARASRAWPRARGSRRAAAGLLDALQNSAFAGGAIAALALGRPALALGALGAAGLVAARHASGTAAEVDESEEALVLVAAVETAKRLTRGLGTLVGLAELARPSRWPTLRGGATGGLAPRAPPAVEAPLAPRLAS